MQTSSIQYPPSSHPSQSIFFLLLIHHNLQLSIWVTSTHLVTKHPLEVLLMATPASLSSPQPQPRHSISFIFHLGSCINSYLVSQLPPYSKYISQFQYIIHPITNIIFLKPTLFISLLENLFIILYCLYKYMLSSLSKLLKCDTFWSYTYPFSMCNLLS